MFVASILKKILQLELGRCHGNMVECLHRFTAVLSRLVLSNKIARHEVWQKGTTKQYNQDPHTARIQGNMSCH